MGYQMAYNLFSKQYVQAEGSGPLGFVVCDAVADSDALVLLQSSLNNTPEPISVSRRAPKSV